ncbi:partial Poly(ribitol-phosphate) beta-N-acetylglucosaminyltransferase TarP, partial [Anaerolineae bacterium]
MEIFSSTIIPTINRATLSRAVCSVLDQEFSSADFEVIVVNDSGQSLPDMDWRHSRRVREINTNRRERSVARNTGAAIAQGRYLHFLDDDDVLLPGALDAFWKLSQEASNASWLYGSYRTVDNDDNLIEEIHPGITRDIIALLVAGEALPFQASFFEAKQVFAAGAFDSTITGVEDRDLGRRIALCTMVAYTPAVVAQIRIGEQGSTTNWAILDEDDRRGREKILNVQNASPRLRVSADSLYWYGRLIRSYCYGRILRTYIASMVWNLQRKNWLIASSRAIASLA